MWKWVFFIIIQQQRQWHRQIIVIGWLTTSIHIWDATHLTLQTNWPIMYILTQNTNFITFVEHRPPPQCHPHATTEERSLYSRGSIPLIHEAFQTFTPISLYWPFVIIKLQIFNRNIRYESRGVERNFCWGGASQNLPIAFSICWQTTSGVARLSCLKKWSWGIFWT